MPTGAMRWLAPLDGRLDAAQAERAYLVGYDQIPWLADVHWQPGELSIFRELSDSGRLCIPVRVADWGELVLCTGTLMERERPYHLFVELARGKLNQVRNQLDDWSALGLQVPQRVRDEMRASLAALARSVIAQADPASAAALAEAAIAAAVRAGEALVGAYIEQAIAARQRQGGPLPTLLGFKLPSVLPSGPTVDRLTSAFNLATLPVVWRQVEAAEGKYRWEETDARLAWSRSRGLKVIGGPLLRLDEVWLPAWLYLWEGDFDNVVSFVSDFVETTVRRYRGQVDMWLCAARINMPCEFKIDEEQRLQLAVRTIEIARRVDPNTPVMVRFDQPWAEYMANTPLDLSPLHFADALVRSGLEIDGLGLEINMGYHPGGSSPRDRLEFSRLIDLWSYLGLPLHLTLTYPSGASDDPCASRSTRPLPQLHGGPPSMANQASWLEQFLPLFLCKPAVKSVVWHDLDDSQPHEFPHGGLIDEHGKPKPGLDVFARLRKAYLA